MWVGKLPRENPVFHFLAFGNPLGAKFGSQMAHKGEKNEKPDFPVAIFQPTFIIRKIGIGIDSDMF